MVATIRVRLGDQRARGPSAVALQSCAATRAAISPSAGAEASGG